MGIMGGTVGILGVLEFYGVYVEVFGGFLGTTMGTLGMLGVLVSQWGRCGVYGVGLRGS